MQELPCSHQQIWASGLAKRLGVLSARALSPSASGLAAERAAKRCVRHGDLIAVAMRIPKSIEEERRRKCRSRFCPKGGSIKTDRQMEKQREVERVATVMDRNAGAAASERAKAAASEGKGGGFPNKLFVDINTHFCCYICYSLKDWHTVLKCLAMS